MCINNTIRLIFFTKLKLENTAKDVVTWYKVHSSQQNSHCQCYFFLPNCWRHLKKFDKTISSVHVDKLISQVNFIKAKAYMFLWIVVFILSWHIHLVCSR